MKITIHKNCLHRFKIDTIYIYQKKNISTFYQKKKIKNHLNKFRYDCLQFAKLDKSILIYKNMHFKKKMAKSRY